MGHRLSRIYTRTGDDGTTGLADGSRLAKDDLRVECMGTIDELNSFLGVVLAHEMPPTVRQALVPVQHRLFDVGAELALPEYEAVTAQDVTVLEQRLDELNSAIPPLKEFILPGGNGAAAHCHLARAICRRAERVLVALDKREPVRRETLSYVNRLSDLLFVAARVIARHEGGQEILWESGRE